MSEAQEMGKICDTKVMSIALATALAQTCLLAEAQDHMKTTARTADVQQSFPTVKHDLHDMAYLREAVAILSAPPHNLTDTEYFKVSHLMTPGQWSENGRNHEIALRSDIINGRPALIYDFWTAIDPAKDGPNAQMKADDIRGRAVFFPNAISGQVEIHWFRASGATFDRQSVDFDRSLKNGK